MRMMNTKNIRPGMVTARPVYGNQGQMLLNTEVKLLQSYIDSLIRNSIQYVYIYDPNLEDVSVVDVVSESTRVEAYTLTKEIMEKTKNGSNNRRGLYLQDKKILKTVDNIINDLLQNKDIVVNIHTIKSADSYTFTHSMDVCILATLTAVKMKLPQHKIKELSVGALLHDLGKTKVPNTILNKPGSLTKDEFEIIKDHPTYGFEIFKTSSLFSSTAGSVIHQHHERNKGQGYPQGLTGDETNILAKIASIADVYDALLSNRPYRKSYHPSEAIEIVAAMGDDQLDLEVLRTFLSFVAAYNVGTHVLLSNGQSGIVIGNTEGYSQRPKVRVLYKGADHTPLPAPYDLDLTEKIDIVITGVADE